MLYSKLILIDDANLCGNEIMNIDILQPRHLLPSWRVNSKLLDFHPERGRFFSLLVENIHVPRDRIGNRGIKPTVELRVIQPSFNRDTMRIKPGMITVSHC